MCEDARQLVATIHLRFADLSELNLEGNTTIDFPDGRDKLTHFHIIFSPVDGMYAGGKYTFSFNVEAGYPHTAPKVWMD